MPTFRYVGDDDRYYITGVTPQNGEEYEFDADPGDGRWEPVGDAAPKRKSATPKAEASADAETKE